MTITLPCAISRARCWLWMAWATLAAPPTLAQVAGTLPPVVVTGQSTPGPDELSSAWDDRAPIRELPVSATVIDASRLREQRADRLEDLVGLVPGMAVGVSSAGLSTAVQLRGFDLTRLHYGGLPDIQRLFARDLATIERVEVLAGPAAVLFGITSPGGVVNYVAKRPSFTPRHELATTLGSHALVRGVLDSTGPLGEVAAGSGLAYRVVAAAQDGHTAVADLPTRRQQGLGALTWAYRSEAGAQGSITADLQEQRNQTPFLFGTVITNGDTATPLAVQRAQVAFDRLYVVPGGGATMRRYHSGGLAWEHAFDDSLRLSAQYRRAVVTRDETLLGFWTVETPTELSGYYTRYHDSYRQHNAQLKLELRRETGPLGHHVTVGYGENRSSIVFSGVQNIGGFALDVAQPDFTAVDVAALRTTSRFNSEAQRDSAWWAADRISFGAAKATHLTLGLRHLRYAIDSDRRGTGRVPSAADSGNSGHVGLSTSLRPGLQAYVAWSSGIEASRGKTRDGSFLPSQQSRQWESGVNWQVAPEVGVRTALYRIDLLNLPMTDPSDRTASISAGQRRVLGAETSLNAAWRGWQWRANAGALRSRHLTKTDADLGESFVGVPAWTAGSQLGHDFKITAGVPVRVWAAVTGVGRRFADAQNSVMLPSHARWDAGGEWVLGPGRSLGAGVRNLGNRRYVEAVTALDDVYQGPLRQAWLTFTLTL